MAYDITTIGSLLGSCGDCGKPQKLDVARIAGVVDTAEGIFDRLNPLSDNWWVRDVARRAATKIEEKADQARSAVDPLPPILDGIGVPTWGYASDVITGVALVGAVAAVGLVVYRMKKTKKNGKAKR